MLSGAFSLELRRGLEVREIKSGTGIGEIAERFLRKGSRVTADR
jgi:hypothetical protein